LDRFQTTTIECKQNDLGTSTLRKKQNIETVLFAKALLQVLC